MGDLQQDRVLVHHRATVHAEGTAADRVADVAHRNVLGVHRHALHRKPVHALRETRIHLGHGVEHGADAGQAEGVAELGAHVAPPFAPQRVEVCGEGVPALVHVRPVVGELAEVVDEDVLGEVQVGDAELGRGQREVAATHVAALELVVHVVAKLVHIRPGAYLPNAAQWELGLGKENVTVTEV